MSEFESRIDNGPEGEGVIFYPRRQDELPMNVALARRLDSMSDKEWDATLRYHLELAAEFDGPGGS